MVLNGEDKITHRGIDKLMKEALYQIIRAQKHQALYYKTEKT